MCLVGNYEPLFPLELEIAPGYIIVEEVSMDSEAKRTAVVSRAQRGCYKSLRLLNPIDTDKTLSNCFRSYI